MCTLEQLAPREAVQDVHLFLRRVLRRLVGLDALPEPVAAVPVRNVHELQATRRARSDDKGNVQHNRPRTKTGAQISARLEHKSHGPVSARCKLPLRGMRTNC